MDWKQELMKRLDAMAEKLGTTGQYLWGVLVRQGFATGVADLAVAGVMLILMGVSVAVAYSHYTKGMAERWHDESRALFVIVPLLVFSGTTIAFGVNLYNGLLEVMNPAYFALNEVLKALGK